MNTQKQNLRSIVRGAYDLQKLRIATGNRIVEQFRSKLGLSPGEKEGDDKEAKKLLDDIRADYDRITDGIVNLPRPSTFKGGSIISEYTELVLVAQYVELLRQEERHFRRIGNVLLGFQIYTSFLQGVRGIGPAMAGVLISEIDIHKAEYPSSIWRYAGLDVGPDGRGRSRRSEHLIEVSYTDSNGDEKTRNAITFNPFLKTKITGVLATSFLRSASPYRAIYDGYKHRLETDPAKADWTKLHVHNASLRYMVKQFLVDLYREWRTIEGLPVAPPYSEAKMGIVHRKAG